jgi:NADH-quinone oxidoreductase subunit J
MRNTGLKFLGLIIALILLRQIYSAIKGARALFEIPGQLEPGFGEARTVGELLFTEYVYPLELIAILLLVAIVGALVLAGKESS